MTADRAGPGCSLLVLTYNQEGYVRAAVEAALAQTLSPLEILISDDCSTDGTFDRIQAALRGYDGPHRVRLHRNERNIGLTAHINQAVNMASGDILIPAYGDDISFPERAACIRQAFADHDPLLVHSHAIPIDERGARTGSAYTRADFFRTTDPLVAATSMALYLGASGGWSRALFEKYGPLRHADVYDDHILGFRAALEGRVHLIDRELLWYREGVGISHLKREGRTRKQNRARRVAILSRLQAALSDRREDALRFGLAPGHQILDRIDGARCAAQARLSYYEDPGSMPRRIMQRPGTALPAVLSEALRDLRKR